MKPEDFPEVMKANKRMVGQICTLCEEAFLLGQPLRNCRDCRGSFHQSCWNGNGGCGNAACSKVTATSQIGNEGQGFSGTTFGGVANPMLPPLPQIAQTMLEKPVQSMIPCRWCREAIARGARKCRHCGELQFDTDRKSHAKNSTGGNIPFVTQLWGMGIMLIFSLFLLLQVLLIFLSFASGRIGETIVMGFGIFISGVIFRMGRGLQTGERQSVWGFGLIAGLNLLYSFAMLRGGPAGLIALVIVGVLYLPPLISAFTHWDEFH